MRNITGSSRSAWSWIPTLYLAEGVPYVAVMTIAVIMYDRMGISHTDIAFYTAWLYLPWVIKPLWSPFVDILRTRRWWIVVMQFLLGAAMAGVAFTLPAPFFFRATLAFFWLMAFSSATHDIAADGFYMLALSTHEQSFFVGIRSTFYRIAMIAGQGLLVMVAGQLEIYTRVEVAWSLTFGAMACCLSFLPCIICVYCRTHKAIRWERWLLRSYGGSLSRLLCHFSANLVSVSLCFSCLPIGLPRLSW